MKNKLKYLSGLILCLVLHTNLFPQDAITVEVFNATFIQGCNNGVAKLEIAGGFSPYDVVWYNEGGEEIQANSGITGEDDGAFISSLSPGTYTVEVEDALCGKTSESFDIICECSQDCIIEGRLEDASCKQGGDNRS